MKVIGKVIKKGVIEKGEYKGRAYCNLQVFVTYDLPESNPTSSGSACEIIKVRTDPEKIYSEIDVGDDVQPIYDRFGNCIRFLPLE